MLKWKKAPLPILAGMSEEQREDLKVRLMSRTELDPETGCINWTGCRSHGYGVLRVGRKVHKTHRIALELAHGSAPPGLLACHRCANPACLNADHLYYGTHQDNADDRVADGHSYRKLSDRDVAVIIGLILGGVQKKAAAIALGVSEATVQLITLGRSRRDALWREAEKSLDLDADSDDHGEVYPIHTLDAPRPALQAA